MGYRSDVAIALPKEIFALAPNYIKDDEDAEDVVDCGEHVVILYNAVKWYEDFPDVQQIMEFLYSLPNDKWGFIRVGEEPDDIEQKGSPDNYGMYALTTTQIYFS